MKKKNIIVFMTDQQLGDTIMKDSIVKTPNVDKFREQAVHFQDAYTASPHCCPSRATFFSGLMPSQHGVWHNVENNNAISRDLFEGIKLFPSDLKEHGYNTYFSGKWHVSAFAGPEDHGFDHKLRYFLSNYGQMKRENVAHSEDWDNFYSDKSKVDQVGDEKHFGQIIRPGYPTYYQFGVDENPFGDRQTVDLAVDAIDNYDDEAPFFMYVGTVGPHDPYTPPQEYLDMYQDVEIKLPDNFEDDMLDVPAFYRRTRDMFSLTREENIESLRRYYAFCTFEDALFGQVLDAIERKDLLEDTIILYLSDHGDTAGAHGLWAKGIPCYRESYSICALIGGGGIEGSTVANNFVTLADFAPTILELAEIPCDRTMAGKSLVPFLEGKKPENWRTEVFTQTNGNEMYGIQRAAFNHKWKYVFNGFDYDVLYDLEKDPLELKNIINEEGSEEIVKEMCKKMWIFGKEVKDNCTCPYIMTSFVPYGPGIILE
ncbi:MAG: sulfatase-like hydrolase/transferase [Eubacteriales bacterium]